MLNDNGITRPTLRNESDPDMYLGQTGSLIQIYPQDTSETPLTDMLNDAKNSKPSFILLGLSTVMRERE